MQLRSDADADEDEDEGEAVAVAPVEAEAGNRRTLLHPKSHGSPTRKQYDGSTVPSVRELPPSHDCDVALHEASLARQAVCAALRPPTWGVQRGHRSCQAYLTHGASLFFISGQLPSHDTHCTLQHRPLRWLHLVSFFVGRRDAFLCFSATVVCAAPRLCNQARHCCI